MLIFVSASSSTRADTAAKIDAYLQPYVDSHNFSGAVLVEQNGRRVFERAYGMANREKQQPNTVHTRFHVASISMQFTAAAILRLVDRGQLQLDAPVSRYVSKVTSGDKITVRDLLMERSGLTDINSLPEYDDILQQHQTPENLVARVSGRPLLFEPGTKFLHEEHSAYNLLALIIEKKTGLGFAAAMEKLVFKPAGLAHSYMDDDRAVAGGHHAQGYAPEGWEGLAGAPAIHWSAKSGNGSACTTVGDEARWVGELLHGHFLSEASRQAMFDMGTGVGFGWFKDEKRRFGEPAYIMNGRAPGFSSFLMHLPREALTVVVLSNIYSSATTPVGYDIARIALGRDYEPLRMGTPLSAAALRSFEGVFQFGEDFYQKNARLVLRSAGSYLSLVRPSGGSESALIPIAEDEFRDRSYWEPVRIERDSSGAPAALHYGEFRGTVVRGN